jgi:uncharacterized membrane protein (DUF373 family)
MNILIEFLTIPVAHAQTAKELVGRVNQFVINPLIAVLFAVAFIVFVYGLYEGFFAPNAGDDARKKGKDHILWGLIGMAIMVSVFGIMNLIINTFDIRGVNPETGDIGNLRQQ